MPQSVSGKNAFDTPCLRTGPPPPPAPPLPPKCSLPREVNIVDLVSVSNSSCVNCQDACRAVSGYIARNGETASWIEGAKAVFHQDVQRRGGSWIEILCKDNQSRATLEICIDGSRVSLADLDGVEKSRTGRFCKYALSLPWSTGSTESIKWARECLARCERSHEQCRPLDSILPKRVLDLQCASEDGDALQLRLSKRDETGRYATLSHGWGEVHPPKTLLSNVDTHLKAIKLLDLSLKFRQIIKFVRGLGIRFLWIDSLCIIQDDPADKMEQIPKMCEVYSNSVLTISTSCSTSSTGALFTVPTTPRKGFPLVDDRLRPSLLIRERFPHVSDIIGYWDTDARDDAMNKVFPLMRRAWVLQERFLSARILHFGTHELHWECNTEAKCQCGNESRRYGKPYVVKEKTEWAYYHSFMLLLEYYSTLELSYESDGLFALQGIMTRYEALTNQRITAGLWEDDPIYCLHWFPRTTQPRRRNANVPTWSWASSLSGVRNEGFAVYPTCTIKIEKISDKSLRDYARSDYALRLRAWITKDGSFQNNDGKPCLRLPGNATIHFTPDIQLLDGVTLSMVELGQDRTDVHEFQYLILQRAKGHRLDVFERIAVVRAQVESRGISSETDIWII
jgi:hypothetical protein